LTEAYKPQFYFWEAIECIRRLLLASVVGIISKDEVVAPVFGLLVSLGFTFLFTAFRPFQNSDDSTLGIILSNAVSVFFLAALIVLAGFIGDDDANSQSSFGVTLIVVFLLGPLFILVRSAGGNMKMIATAAFSPPKTTGGKQPRTDLEDENTATTESADNDESAATNDLPLVVGGATSKSSSVEGSESRMSSPPKARKISRSSSGVSGSRDSEIAYPDSIEEPLEISSDHPRGTSLDITETLPPFVSSAGTNSPGGGERRMTQEVAKDPEERPTVIKLNGQKRVQEEAGKTGRFKDAKNTVELNTPSESKNGEVFKRQTSNQISLSASRSQSAAKTRALPDVELV